MMTQSEYTILVTKNAGAFGLNVAAWLIAGLTEVEQWLRITSLVVGIVAGIFAIALSFKRLRSAGRGPQD